VIETLAAEVRERTPSPVDPHGLEPSPEEYEVRNPLFVEAILAVIGRRRRENDPPERRLDLSRTTLLSINLRGGDFAGCAFDHCCLDYADLRGANLRGASFRWCTVDSARFDSKTQVDPGVRRWLEAKGEDVERIAREMGAKNAEALNESPGGDDA
jgi:uncharacterized protein YjbI with pentapeptide repeats